MNQNIEVIYLGRFTQTCHLEG